MWLSRLPGAALRGRPVLDPVFGELAAPVRAGPRDAAGEFEIMAGIWGTGNTFAPLPTLALPPCSLPSRGRGDLRAASRRRRYSSPRSRGRPFFRGSDDLGLLQHLRHLPRLRLADLARGDDLHEVAHLDLVRLVVRVVLRRARDDLAVDRMLDAALDEHRDRLVHLVADHATDERRDQRLACRRRLRILLYLVDHASPAFWCISVRTRAI